MSVAGLQLARLRHIGATTGVTAGAAALSQATGAAGLLTLPLLGRSTADTYAVGLQLGFASFAGVAMGVAYNLAIGRPAWRHWRSAAVAAAASSLALTAITLSYLAATGGLAGGRGWIIAFFGVGGGGLAWCGTALVRAACMGRPVPLAAIAIGPNVLLAATVPVAAWTDSGVVWPAATWCLSTLGMAVVASRRAQEPSARPSGRQPDSEEDSQRLHGIGLALGVVTQTVVPILLVSGATRLAAGTALVLFFVNRVVAAGLNVGVNSFLLARYSWGRSGVQATRAFAVATAAATAAAAAGLTLHLVNPGLLWLPIGMVLLAFTTLVVISAIVMREVNHRRMARTVTAKVVLDLVLSAAGLSVYLARPTVSGFFGVCLVSQCVTVLVCAVGLKKNRWAGVSVVGLSVSAALVVFGW